METDSKPTTKQRVTVRIRRTLSTMFRVGRVQVRHKPLTGRAGALAALDRLYEENDAGLKRLADG
ncbi:hypothetical protein N9C85_01675 [Synechococcus sp. AH-224-I15]|nr:hypothetical protein [Synechococcus sp. AH-224-I15]